MARKTRRHSRSPAQPRRRWVAVLAALLPAAVSLALYANALANPFISDDRVMVANNPTLSQLSAAGLANIWVTDYWAQTDRQGRVFLYGYDRNLYRPVTVFTFWLNALVADVAPADFRVVNILLHAAAAGMVGLWAARWVGRAGGAVAAIAVLFHPVATDVVNRIVGRADILVLLGVAGALAIQRGAQQKGWTWTRCLAAAAWTLLAVGSKESGIIVLPLAIVQWWIGRRRPTGPKAAPNARSGSRGPPWQGVISLIAPLALYFTARFLVVRPPSYAADPTWDLLENPAIRATLAERVPVLFALGWHYLRTLLVPFPLIAFDVPQHVPTWTQWQVWAGLAAVAALLALAAGLLVRRGLLVLAVAWWGSSLLIVGQLLAPIGAYTEVRLAYPFLGALGLAAGWAAALVARLRPRRRWTAVTAGAIVCCVSGWYVVDRNRDYRSQVALLEADAARRPDSPAATIRLANAYIESGRLRDAEEAFIRTTQLAPRSANAWSDLGGFYAADRGDYERALHCLRKAVGLNPRHHLAWMAQGVIAMRTGRLQDAERFLTLAVTLAPDKTKIQYNMAVFEVLVGRLESASRRLEYILEREPAAAKAGELLEQVRAMQTARPGGKQDEPQRHGGLREHD